MSDELAIDVSGMTKRGEADSVVDFKHFASLAADGEQKQAVRVIQEHGRAAAAELVFDVLAPVGDCLDPTIWFFNHTSARYAFARSVSEISRMPSLVTTRTLGKMLVFGL